MKKTTIPWPAHILTFFPEMFPGPLEFSITGKALKEKIWLWAHRPPRGYETLTQNHRPFGIGSFCTVGMRAGLSGGHVSARDLKKWIWKEKGNKCMIYAKQLKNKF